MVAYTSLTPIDLATVERRFGLPPITSVEAFAEGQENSNYHLQAGERDYVLTVCETKTVAEAQTLAETLRHLEAHGFETTRVIPTVDGAMQADLNGRPLLLKSYLEGEVVDRLPLEAMAPVGRAMARLHQVPVPDFVPNQLSFGRQTFAHMRERFGRAHPFLDWLETVERFLEAHLPDELPRALIHADVFADNVILTPADGPVIMDFEEAANYARVLDLGMAFVGTCYPDGVRDDAARRELLSGYGSVVTLSDTEKDALDAATVYAAAGMASWRFWQFNVVQPHVGKQEHYRELQQIAIDLLQA